MSDESKKANVFKWRKSKQLDINDEKRSSSPDDSSDGETITFAPAVVPQPPPVSFFSLFRYVNHSAMYDMFDSPIDSPRELNFSWI